MVEKGTKDSRRDPVGQLFTQLKHAELRNLSGGIWHWLDDAAPSAYPTASRQLDKSGTNITNVAPTTLAGTYSNARFNAK
jgi:hypothetical protein